MPLQGFNQWYQRWASQFGLDPNPNSPLHFYDWKAAFLAGAQPDPSGHWPSKFKKLGHPNLIVDGMDTRTETPATPALSEANSRAYWLGWIRASNVEPVQSSYNLFYKVR